MSTILDAPPTAWPLPTEFKPRAFQLEGLRLAVQRDFVFDVGLGGGKTTMSLAAAEALGAMRVLVLAPLRVIAVWRDEVSENAARQWVVWSGAVHGARGPLKNPSVPRRAEALIGSYTGAVRLRRPFMAVVNYEAILARDMLALALGTPWDLVICDESHKLAGAGAKTSRQIARVTQRVRDNGGRIILQTGTLMPHSALSLYGQFRALDPAVLGSSWTNFKARYAAWRVLRVTPLGDPVYHKTPRGDLIPDGVRPDREHELMARIAPHTLRVSQAELDAQTGLVETPPQLRTCVLRPETRRVYDALERDLIARTNAGVITSANAMVNVLRLAQVTSGYGVDARDATGKTHLSLAADGGLSEKAKLLADILDDEVPDPREPVVIFARFRHDLDQIAAICAKQGRRYGEISGRRADGLDGHRMAQDIDVVGVQPQAGGAGISLTRAALCIFYTSDWSLAGYDQAKRRVLRQGQTRHVTYLHLVATDTVDESLFYALKKRRATNEAVLARLQRKDTP